MRALFNWDFLRFGIVSVLGLGFDLSIAWCLAVLANVPLPAAALLGFLVGAAINYLLHETWTFRSATRRPSGRRWLLYLATLVATLLTRVAVVALLDRWLFTGAGQQLATLLTATGVSFVVNYILSKYLVFRPARARIQLTPEPEPE